ncbi:MAG: adenylosuccinate lyase [Thermoplasmata archaeon]|nr:adenylosuccinate lyase [Thermoplasmata archaeon]
MSVCPIEFRYGRDEVKRIFSQETRLRHYQRVEAALAAAQADVGMVPHRAAEAIAAAVDKGLVHPSRVDDIEAEIKHDVMALVIALSEKCGDAGRYVHLGATSYDIVDTATALQMKEYLEVLRGGLVGLRDTLLDLAVEHRDTVMIGRTHGQHAVPITFGLKMAVFSDEVHRHVERLDELAPRLLVGKMSGAVGSMAAMGPNGPAVEERTMALLGLLPERASTQIVQRDRLIEFVSLAANIATSVEKFATEVRNLQRTEIAEVSERFSADRQVGSSTMAQKRNPIMAENLTGLARTVRGFVGPAWEGAVQWHERDLSNSSSERFVLSHVAVLLDDIVVKAERLFRDLEVDAERMEENMGISGGRVMAERVIMALVERGIGRQDAHERVRRASMACGDFTACLLEDEAIAGALSLADIEALLDPRTYVGSSGAIVDRVVAHIRGG